MERPDRAGGAVELLWIPLGAGDHVVKVCGRAYEAIAAARDHRDRRDLFHSALLVTVSGHRWAIESAPASGGSAEARGVVASGPVGLTPAGRLRLFRYEIRCRRDGSIPDADAAVGGPILVTDEPAAAARILDIIASVPTPVWGRDQLRTGDMWNSNSLTSWLLEGAGIDAGDIALPAGGRAPGWRAGITVARREGVC